MVKKRINMFLVVISFLMLLVAFVVALNPSSFKRVDTGLNETIFEVGFEDIFIETVHSGIINIQVSYPKGTSKLHPLIIFSHGSYLTNTDYYALTNKWVEHGYVVIAPMHLDSGETDVVDRLRKKVGSDWMSAARVLDMQEILNQVDRISDSLEMFEGRIKVDSAVAAGHSFGALSSQVIAGASLETQGNSIYPIPETLKDDRIVAVVAISPPGMVPQYLSEKTWQSLVIPQLVVTGTRDVFEYIWTDYREHFVSYNSAQPGDNYLLVLDGMDHYLGNLIGRLNREEAPQVQSLRDIVEQSLLFMDAHLATESSETSMMQLNNFEAFLQRSSVLIYERR